MLSAIRGGIIALALAPSVLTAQNCKKGIPCGHSCISASKVCHIQSTPVPPPSDAPAVRGLVASPPPTTAVSPSSSAGGITYPFIGSFADGIYFVATCSAAQDLAR